MTDPIDFESRLQARLLAHTADVVRPFDAAAISSSVAARTRPTAWSMRTPALSRRVTVGLVTVLALAMAAVVVGIAANRGPRPIGDGERLFASGSGRGGWAYIVQDGALATFKMPFGRLQPWCPHLIPRTTVIDQVAWGGRDLIDLVTGRTVATIPTRYAGFERWSPDGRRLLLGDFGGRVGIVTFDDVATPVTRWFDAPGLENADWSRESDLVAVSRIVDGRLVIEVIDAARGATSTVLQARLSDLPDPAVPGGGVSVTWSSRGHVAVSIDHPDLTTRDVVVVDTADGTSTTIPNLAGGPLAWSPDGSRFAMGGDPSTISIVEASGARSIDVPVASAVEIMKWSPDGTRLAFVDDGDLTVVRSDGSGRQRVPVGPAPFVWDRDGSGVVVATPLEPGGIAVDHYRADDLSLDTRITSAVGIAHAAALCLEAAGPSSAP